MPIGAGSIRAISGLSPLDSPSNCTFVRRNVGLTFLLAQSAFFGLYGVNKGHFGGLDSVFKIRDCHHRIRRKFLRQIEGLFLF